MTEKTIQFGKYKSKAIQYIIENDISYAKWMFEHPTLVLDDYITKILSDTFQDKDEHYLTFGKYKNKSLSWIKANDKKYIYYLKKNEYVINKLPDLHRAL